MNTMVEFLNEHHVSVARQDISDFSRHCARREKLYRQLGMPSLLFKDANICEVGPGGGYNSIVYKVWGSQLTLIEPSEAGRSEIRRLFGSMNLAGEYELINACVENYHIDKKFDIVIAEGFVPVAENWREVLNVLMELVDTKGILVITCQDEMGMFVERMKRLIAQLLVRDITEFDKKVVKLVELFAPQLKSLNGMSRLPEDWVQAQLLCESILVKSTLNLKEAVQYAGGEWEVLGSSGPNCFEDYSWYKDLEKDYKKEYCKQYDKKSYNLILAGREPIDVEVEDVNHIRNHIMKIRDLEIQFEQEQIVNKKIIDDIIVELEKVKETTEEFDVEVAQFVCDTIEILDKVKETGEIVDINNYPTFFSAFGRTQQYISLIKNI